MSMKCLYCRTGKVDVKWQTPHANVIENSERLANVVAGEGEGRHKNTNSNLIQYSLILCTMSGSKAFHQLI